MKALLIASAILLISSISAQAQAVEAPPIQPILRSSNTTLNNGMKLNISSVTVIRSHDKEYRVDKDLSLKSIKKEWIETIDILQDSVSVHKYTKLANRSVVIVTLKDKEYPEAFKALEKNLIRM